MANLQQQPQQQQHQDKNRINLLAGLIASDITLSVTLKEAQPEATPIDGSSYSPRTPEQPQFHRLTQVKYLAMSEQVDQGTQMFSDAFMGLVEDNIKRVDYTKAIEVFRVIKGADDIARLFSTRPRTTTSFFVIKLRYALNERRRGIKGWIALDRTNTVYASWMTSKEADQYLVM